MAARPGPALLLLGDSEPLLQSPQPARWVHRLRRATARAIAYKNGTRSMWAPSGPASASTTSSPTTT